MAQGQTSHDLVIKDSLRYWKTDGDRVYIAGTYFVVQDESFWLKVEATKEKNLEIFLCHDLDYDIQIDMFSLDLVGEDNVEKQLCKFEQVPYLWFVKIEVR